MSYIFLYIAFFGIWLFLNKKNGFNTSSFILLFYLFSAICCLFIFIFYPHTILYPDRVTLESVSFHILTLFLFLSPLVYIGNKIKAENLSISDKVLKNFSYCIIIPSVISIIVSFSDAINIFAFGDLSVARNTLLSDNSLNYVYKYGVLGYFISLGPIASFLCLFFSFYYRFYRKDKGVITNLLFFSSFSFVINNFTIAGRDGVIRWILFFIFSCIFFKNYLSFKDNRKFWINVLSFGACIIIIFLLISEDRFGERDDSTFFHLLNYYGQPFYYFSYIYQTFADTNIYGIGSIFPAFSQNIHTIYNLNDFIYADYFLNVFSTFVGSILLRTGAINTFIISLCSFILLFFSFRHFRTISLNKIIVYIFFYEIYILGLFYFMHSGRMTQLGIIFYIIIAYFLSFINKLK